MRLRRSLSGLSTNSLQIGGLPIPYVPPMVSPPFTGIYGGRDRPGTSDSTVPYVRTSVLPPTSSHTNMRIIASPEMGVTVKIPAVESMHRTQFQLYPCMAKKAGC